MFVDPAKPCRSAGSITARGSAPGCGVGCGGLFVVVWCVWGGGVVGGFDWVGGFVGAWWCWLLRFGCWFCGFCSFYCGWDGGSGVGVLGGLLSPVCGVSRVCYLRCDRCAVS
ncbi:hypothetical protein, partial [Pseudomonas syringae group genomosp. 7]|uniref:hypothetical protein n=1 Tax=Pseudomonas syringae group genomosp. 7 TaxID=251699 RepID=UPI0037703637